VVAVNGDAPGTDSDRAAGRPDLAGRLQSTGLDRRRLAYWTVTGLLLVGLSYFAWEHAGVLIVGLFVYYVCRPVFARIHARIQDRTVAVGVTLVTVALPTLLLVAWTVAVLVQAVVEFLGTDTASQLTAIAQPYVAATAELENLDQVVEDALADPQGFSAAIGPVVSSVADGVLAAVATLGLVGLQAFIVLVIAFYLLRDDHRLAAWARRTFAPEDSVTETYFVRVDRDLERIFFGNILNALATGLIAVASYFLLNLVAPPVVAIPQSTLLGLLVGVASLVPAVGIKLVTWPLGFYLLARSLLLAPQTLWFPAVFFVVSFVVVDYIPDQLLRPYVSGRGLHVGAVMLAYLFGPILFGWYGIFLGPFLLAVLFEFGRVVVPWLTNRRSDPAPPLDAAMELPVEDGRTDPTPPPSGFVRPEQADADSGTSGNGDGTDGD
jgi:predicted PurR-regulated permease PerM